MGFVQVESYLKCDVIASPPYTRLCAQETHEITIHHEIRIGSPLCFERNNSYLK